MKLQGVDRTILVQSSNVDLGEVLPDYARTSILQMAGKYLGSEQELFPNDGVV